MPRGRNPEASNERVLLELLIHDDRAVFTAEIAEQLPIDTPRVRQIMAKLVDEGYAEKKTISNRNLYSLTDTGRSHMADHLREMLD
jgi:predicted ArsR family transcriptional regulator